MNFWKILGIEPTDDVTLIKKAYKAKLKSNRPEDDEDAFMKLRAAYESALEYAESGANDYSYTNNNINYKSQDYDEDYDEDEDEEYYEVSPERLKYLNWMNKIKLLHNDYYRRNKVEEWNELLYNDIPYEFEYYQLCRNFIHQFLCVNERIFLPQDVRVLINNFFSFSKEPMERAKSDEKRKMLTELNHKLKICENIRFDKLNPLEMNGKDIDVFFYRFDKVVSNFEDMDALKEYPLFYMPLECLYIFYHWEKYTFEEKNKRVEELIALKERYLPESDNFEIEYLQAMLAVESKDYAKAYKLLKELYMKIEPKDYLSIYLLAVCCRDVGMYFEAYMLVKQLTWLNPRPYMYEMAENIYQLMDNNYINKIEAGNDIDDLEHIHMCRMYLRSNREKEAVDVLKRVKDSSKYPWEYEVANVMCIFYEDSISVPSNLYLKCQTWDAEPPMEVLKAKHSFNILENYPKDKLGNIEKLEWQELKARYLFEQRNYVECDILCNELLEDYPVSYPILTLRAYSDYNANTYGENNRFTEYMDFTYLLKAMPQRSEIRLVVAQMFLFSKRYMEAANSMLPVQQIYPDIYRVYDIFARYRDADIKSLLYGIKDIFVESMERELDIPPVSKYKLLDLRNILFFACDEGRVKLRDEEISTDFSVYSELEKSYYNHPELYIDWSYLYQFLDMNDKAIEYVHKKLENATERDKGIWYYRLSNLYKSYDDVKTYAEYIKPKNMHRALGFRAYDEENYELAVEHFEKVTLGNNCDICIYEKLGYAYFQLKKYEEAANTYIMAIRKHNITGDVGNGVNCYLEAGCSYYRCGKYDDAIAWLKKGNKYYNKEEDIARYHYLLGLCYEDMGDKEEYVQKRRQEYSKAVEYRFYWEPLYNKLATDYAKLGEKEKAVEVLKIGLEVTGPSGDYQCDYIENLYYDLYVLYSDYYNDFNKAIEYLELMKDNTEHEYFKNDYWYRLGLMYNCLDEKEKMKEAFLKASELNLSYPKIYGKLRLEYEDPREQLEILLKGIELSEGKCVDFDCNNLYESLHFVYMELNDYYNAYVAGLNLAKNTKNKYLHSDGYKLAATAAMMLERTDISCELFRKAIDILKENDEEIPYGITINNLIALYNERKPEAKDVFLSLVEDNIRKNVGHILSAFRAEYMSKGNIDEELAWSYHDELVYLSFHSADKDIYEGLVGIAAALGDDKKQEKYTQELFKYIDSWYDGCEDTYVWCYIYKGDFKKAFEILDKLDEYKSIKTAAIGFADYNFVREKLGMAPHKNVFKPVVDEKHIDIVAKMYSSAADLYYDQEEYEKAIDILNHSLEFVGETGDFSDGRNVYFGLMEKYQYVNPDKMYELSFKLIEKTNNIDLRFEGYKWRATLAICRYHRVQEAYDNYSIAYKMIPDVKFTMEDWELRNYFCSAVLAMRNHYITNEWVDKEFATENLKRFQQAKGKLEDSSLYAVMYEVSTALGDEKLISEYEKLFYEHLENINDEYDTLAWHCIYLGDYEKAYELYTENEEIEKLKKDDSTYVAYEFIKSKLSIKGERE